MTSRVQNMTEGKPLRLILFFALPLMLGNAFQQLYALVDTMVTGQTLGVNAYASWKQMKLSGYRITFFNFVKK